MGDSTWARFTVAESDLPRTLEIAGFAPDDDPETRDEDEGTASVFVEESNYGGEYERDELREAGIPFLCDHGAGYDYGPATWAFDGEVMDSAVLDHEERLVVRVNERTRSVDEADMKLVLAFLYVKARALAAIRARTRLTPQGDTLA